MRGSRGMREPGEQAAVREKETNLKLGAGWAQPLEMGAKMQGEGRGGEWEPLRLSAT